MTKAEKKAVKLGEVVEFSEEYKNSRMSGNKNRTMIIQKVKGDVVWVIGMGCKNAYPYHKSLLKIKI